MILWSAFLVGLMGSFHCVGMCGPIALALPVHKRLKSALILGRVLYNTGRVVTYSILGGFFGLIGTGFSVAGFQQWTSIAAGFLLILYALFPATGVEFTSTPLNRVNLWLKTRFSQLFKRRSLQSQFLIGLFNGLLPCGLVYVALAGAVASGSVAGGFAYMLLFGLGTFPLMLAVSLAGNFIGAKVKSRVNQMIPVFVFAIGVLFVLRGMNLGIPYLSPYIEGQQPLPDVEVCH